jgi:hypothetical protein
LPVRLPSRPGEACEDCALSRRTLTCRRWSTGQLRDSLIMRSKKQLGLAKHRMGWSRRDIPGLHFSPASGWVEPAATCHGVVRCTKPRSGGIFIAWGVSPRKTIGKNKEPRSGDRQSNKRSCGSRRNRDLSPLQGWSYWAVLPPGAHAPGYVSIAPSALDHVSNRHDSFS